MYFNYEPLVSEAFFLQGKNKKKNIIIIVISVSKGTEKKKGRNLNQD